ncbi:arylesterase [Methylobacterium guangdongense]|uniref:arylesterase n=1 Tax=Methylobacterium guangdongense TaxID=3138811 RepID=UPI00399C990C
MGRPLGPRHDGGAVFRRTALFAAALALLMVPFMTATQAAPGGPIKLVALGDSLTAGYKLPADAAFPAVLERMLKARGADVTVANAGVSGDTATGGLDRVDWSVPDGTDGVILELGANDMLRGTDPTVTEGALSAIIARLKARGIPVLIAGMQAAPNLGPDYKARFDAIFPTLAKRYDLTLYPFFLDGIIGDRAQHLDDMLHPNRQGVETIAARMLPTVETFLGGLRQGASR